MIIRDNQDPRDSLVLLEVILAALRASGLTPRTAQIVSDKLCFLVFSTTVEQIP